MGYKQPTQFIHPLTTGGTFLEPLAIHQERATTGAMRMAVILVQVGEIDLAFVAAFVLIFLAEWAAFVTFCGH